MDKLLAVILQFLSVDQVKGVVRHILTTLGGVIFGLSVVTNLPPELIEQLQSLWTTLVAAAVAGVGFLWSYVSKK